MPLARGSSALPSVLLLLFLFCLFVFVVVVVVVVFFVCLFVVCFSFLNCVTHILSKNQLKLEPVIIPANNDPFLNILD